MGNNDLRNGDLGDSEWDNHDLPNGESEPNQTPSSSGKKWKIIYNLSKQNRNGCIQAERLVYAEIHQAQVSFSGVLALVCVRARVYVCVCVCRVLALLGVCVHVCVHKSMWLCVCVCVC